MFTLDQEKQETHQLMLNVKETLIHCGGAWLELNWDPCWIRGEVPGGAGTAGGQVKEELTLPLTVSNKDAPKETACQPEPPRGLPSPNRSIKNICFFVC